MQTLNFHVKIREKQEENLYRLKSFCKYEQKNLYVRLDFFIINYFRPR